MFYQQMGAFTPKKQTEDDFKLFLPLCLSLNFQENMILNILTTLFIYFGSLEASFQKCGQI